MAHLTEVIRPGRRSSQVAVEAEYVALRELSQTGEPTGSRTVRLALSSWGIEVSEATAGRLLADLDSRGLTRTRGTKGRVITDRGREHLAQLEQNLIRDSLHSDLHDAISGDTVADILDLLNARRAVEVEVARLAAMNGSEEEIDQLSQAVRRNTEILARGGDGLPTAVEIRQLLAVMSGSRILRVIVELILAERSLFGIQGRIQDAAGKTFPRNWEALLEKVKARDADGAAQVMRAHIDDVTRVVKEHRPV